MKYVITTAQEMLSTSILYLLNQQLKNCQRGQAINQLDLS